MHRHICLFKKGSGFGSFGTLYKRTRGLLITAQKQKRRWAENCCKVTFFAIGKSALILYEICCVNIDIHKILLVEVTLGRLN